METKPCETGSPEVEPAVHTPLLTRSAAAPGGGSRRPLRPFLLLSASIISLLSLVALINIINQKQQEPLEAVEVVPLPTKQTTSFCNTSSLPRGVAQGVSPKSNPSLPNKVSYNWTNAMLSWQRAAYHFQPQKNWMNDPNGPLYHLGWYHLFYQYNPESAVWGNITWGHAVSRDLIHWLHLPTAMIPDTWFDINGVWTGSATLLPDGKIVMLYTGSTNRSVQVQNLAYPANLSDPLLLHWVKYADNPLLMSPPDVDDKDFRDPTTAWVGPDKKWRVALGSKVGHAGISLVYTTEDFIHFDLNDHYLHEVSGTGMWECVDFYPISVNGSKGLDTSVVGPGVKHVLKVSLDNTKEDHYAIGTYFMENDKWAPDNPNEDVGRGLRLDYGRFYASKSFYDQIKERRILWGWINETDAEYADLKKGWASIQSIPRTVVFDKKTGKNVVQWPVEEVESLRLNSTEFQEILVTPGSVVPLDIGAATQLDIYGEFEIEMVEEKGMDEKEEKVEGCGEGAMHRSTLGPFGILAIADDTLSELTPIYFRLSNTNHPNANTSFCVDQTRSSEATDVLKIVDGGKVRVLSDEKLSMRVLIDHSIIESFGQGGRTVITSRVYPTKAIYGAAKLFVFNNATAINVKVSLKIWQLTSAFIRPFPFDE